jgi:phasin
MTDATKGKGPKAVPPRVAAMEGKFPMPKFELPMLPKFELPMFEMPHFDMPKMEVPAAFRELAEKSVAQARDGYERMKAAAEEATDLLEDSYATASKGATEYTLKALEAVRLNANAMFDFYSELLTVKSVSDVVELTSTHARKQYDTVSTQVKELSALAQKVASESVEPLQVGVSKTFKTAA